MRIDERLQELRRVIQRRRDALRAMERRLDGATPRLGPRGRETVVLMRRAIADTRTELCLAPDAEARVCKAIERVKEMVDRQKRDAPATAPVSSE